MSGAAWELLAQLSAWACGGAALALSGWLLARGDWERPAAAAELVALSLTAAWALALYALGPSALATAAIHALGQLAWLWVLYRLFAQDQRDKSMGPIRPLVAVLAGVGLLELALAPLMAQGGAQTLAVSGGIPLMLRLLFCIGALVLVHNLYAGASGAAREALRWPSAALGLMWLYDLNLSAVAYLGAEQPYALIALRSAIMLVVIAILALGAFRHKEGLRFGPSRSLAFRSFALILISAYLALMVLVAQGLAYVGGDLGRMVQAGFLAVAAALVLVVLPSQRLRGWVRVMVSKHLFQHRYDYRGEWLRFTDTMGRGGSSGASLGERVVQAVADITDSPSGLLLSPGEEGLALDARWQWATMEVPAQALTAEAAGFFEDTRFIVDLDEVRTSGGASHLGISLPAWLIAQHDAWAMVPLVHFERLVGVVVLARPALPRRLDWEDFDLLRVVGGQLASYLAEQASQDALGEALRFDEFNRRIAFVMHDIKNLASQLSLLARNAEKHADKPQFRADMLLTLRNSAEKLQGLLARLGKYQALIGDDVRPVDVAETLQAVARRLAAPNIVIVERPTCDVLADREALEQALVHLVQNALDASDPASPVFVDCVAYDGHAVLEVIDSGEGMSADFIRTRLFKPFNSSKPGGFGIGAFEARELVRAMAGRLEVESREGLGSRFRLHLPLARAAQQIRTDQSKTAEVV